MCDTWQECTLCEIKVQIALTEWQILTREITLQTKSTHRSFLFLFLFITIFVITIMCDSAYVYLCALILNYFKSDTVADAMNSASTYSFMYDDVFNSWQMKCKSKNRDENDEKRVSVKIAWCTYIWAVHYLGDLYVWTNEWSPMIHVLPYTINACTVCTESKTDSDAYSRV